MVLTIVIAGVLALLSGIATNLYSDALVTRYPHIRKYLPKLLLPIGIVLLIIAIVSSFLSASGSPTSSPKRRTGVIPESSTPARSSPRPTESPASHRPDEPPKVRYSGEITVGSGGWLEVAKDLDRVPPANADKDEGGDLTYNVWNSDIDTGKGATIALWRKRRKPSYSDCAEQAVADGMNSLDLKVGETACARTGEGRVVRMKIPRKCRVYCAIFDVTIWELR